MPSLSRRTFVATGAAFVGAIALAPQRRWTEAIGVLGAEPVPAADLSALATFAPHVGTRFTMRRPDSADVALRLVEATPFATAGHQPDLEGEAFSLLFTGPGGEGPGELATLRHGVLGSLTMFVAPVGGDHDWEAVVDVRRRGVLTIEGSTNDV